PSFPGPARSPVAQCPPPPARQLRRLPRLSGRSESIYARVPPAFVLALEIANVRAADLYSQQGVPRTTMGPWILAEYSRTCRHPATNSAPSAATRFRLPDHNRCHLLSDAI